MQDKSHTSYLYSEDTVAEMNIDMAIPDETILEPEDSMAE